MFKKLTKEPFYRLINFGPCVVITSAFNSKVNAAPIAWSMPVNDEPELLAIAVASTHFTAELIEKSGEFVVNVPDVEMLPVIKNCGKISGRKTDKIKKWNIVVEKGVKVKTPNLAASVGFIECSLIDSIDYDGVKLFVGKVLFAGAKPGALKGSFISDKARTINHLGSGLFATLGKRYKM